ncbi:hypothetical protein [Streptomyces sp. NPDC001401]|uniref:hypothetical protein n=1 Tax=Streptomyces sp. NPDC001401 TaxID=3364570 RepID=UPI003691ACED
MISETQLDWAYGTYSVVPHCIHGGVAEMKIDNTTSQSVMAQVESPGYAPGLGWHPLYLAEKSSDSRRIVAVPAHGHVHVYLKLGDTSQECANDATNLLQVIPARPGDPGRNPNR